jgi:(S)-citramalyl-CoA lyase
VNMPGPATQISILSIKSWLFTPGTKPDFFSRASTTGAGALIIDLEDSVAPADKDTARRNALDYLAAKAPDHIPCAVRINPPDSQLGDRDVQLFLASSATADFVILPKSESLLTIRRVMEALTLAQKQTRVIALIETIQGIQALDQIASSDYRPDAILFGAADMAADLGAAVEWEPLLFARSRVVMAGASAGIPIIDAPFFNLADQDGLQKEASAAMKLGFHGKCAIHPSHVAVINDVFNPSAAEIDQARRAIAASQQGVGQVDGRMVDAAFIRNARTILARAGIVVP